MSDYTYVIGHKNPDSDSVCSAIAYARFKRLKGDKKTIAARAGNLNPQTEYVLDRFGVPAPLFLANLVPTVGDAMTTDVVSRDGEASVKEILHLIEDRNIRLVPIIDPEKRYRGMISLFLVAREFYWGANPQGRQEIFTSVKYIRQAINGEVVYGADREAETFQGTLLIGAMRERSFREIFAEISGRNCIVITGDREKIQTAAIEGDARALIVTGGHAVGAKVRELAEKQQTALLISPYDTASTMNLVKLSTPAYKIAQKLEGCLSPATPLEQAKQKILVSRNRGMIVLGEDETLLGIITRADLLRYNKPRLILVDHNELSQAVEGASQAEIIEIIDHHRLANPQTTQPILFFNQPVGSTCTIVARQYFEQKIPLDQETAGLLIAGIVSDTIHLKSPTATPYDGEMLQELNKVAKIDLDDFSNRMFAAGASLCNRPPQELLLSDFKEYAADKLKFGVGQIETAGFEGFHQIKKALLEKLSAVLRERAYHFAALLVTDIISGNSLLLFDGEKELCDRLDYPLKEPRLAELQGVLSRKKQLLPHLLGLFKQGAGK